MSLKLRCTWFPLERCQHDNFTRTFLLSVDMTFSPRPRLLFYRLLRPDVLNVPTSPPCMPLDAVEDNDESGSG